MSAAAPNKFNTGARAANIIMYTCMAIFARARAVWPYIKRLQCIWIWCNYLLIRARESGGRAIIYITGCMCASEWVCVWEREAISERPKCITRRGWINRHWTQLPFGRTRIYLVMVRCQPDRRCCCCWPPGLTKCWPNNLALWSCGRLINNHTPVILQALSLTFWGILGASWWTLCLHNYVSCMRVTPSTVTLRLLKNLL